MPCRNCQRREFPAGFMSEKDDLVTLSLETLQKVKQLKLNKGENKSQCSTNSHRY